MTDYELRQILCTERARCWKCAFWCLLGSFAVFRLGLFLLAEWLAWKR